MIPRTYCVLISEGTKCTEQMRWCGLNSAKSSRAAAKKNFRYRSLSKILSGSEKKENPDMFPLHLLQPKTTQTVPGARCPRYRTWYGLPHSDCSCCWILQESMNVIRLFPMFSSIQTSVDKAKHLTFWSAICIKNSHSSDHKSINQLIDQSVLQSINQTIN